MENENENWSFSTLSVGADEGMCVDLDAFELLHLDVDAFDDLLLLLLVILPLLPT